MNKKISLAKLNPVCLACTQKCKQTAAVTVIDCSRYHRKDVQLELRFTFDNKKRKD